MARCGLRVRSTTEQINIAGIPSYNVYPASFYLLSMASGSFITHCRTSLSFFRGEKYYLLNTSRATIVLNTSRTTIYAITSVISGRKPQKHPAVLG
jgi:hypothetical protein